MFKSILKKMFAKEPEVNIDYTSVITDMHSHLIPGIDDGSQSIEESVELVRELHGVGFRKFITTPHIMNDSYRNNPTNIGEGLIKLQEALKNDPDLSKVSIEAAAEYYVDDGFLQKMEAGKLLTFGKNYLLIEVSYINYPDNLKDVIFKCRMAGYKVILAHPERYPFFYNNFKEYTDLKDLGVLFQLNVNSLSGYYSPGAKKIAEMLIDNNMIEFIGTDTHNMKHIHFLKKTMTEKYLDKLITSGNLINHHLSGSDFM